MKKIPFSITLLVAVLFLKSLHIQAQTLKSLGFRNGFSSTFPRIEELHNGQTTHDKIKNRNMLYSELQAELIPHNHFSLLTTLAYISKGFNWYYSGSGGWFPTDGRYVAAKIDYLAISTAPKFSWQINNITLYGFAGPYLAIRSSYDEYYNNIPSFTIENQDIKILKPLTVGGSIGTGIEFNDKNERLQHSVQLQFMQDFTFAGNEYQKTIDQYGKYYDYKFKAKFQTLLLSYGLHYSFKKKE